MKEHYITFVALAATAIATSCSSDDVVTEQPQETRQETADSKTVTLTASVDEGQTRVGLTKDTDGKTASFYWNNGDAISVQTTSGDSFSNERFTSTASTGDKTATFTAEVTGTVGKYAVYPYNKNHKLTSEKELTYNLPDTYKYEKVESNIFSKDDSYPSNPTNVPMLGIISDNNIKFSCLGGLAVIRIDRMPATSGTLTVTADQQLSGNFTVADVSADKAQITSKTGDLSDEEKKVTFTFNGATKEAVGVFYLPLAPGTYSNVTVKVSYGDNASQTFNHGDLTISRATVKAIALTMDYEFALSDCKIIWSDNGENKTAGTWDANTGKFFAGTNSGAGWEATNDKPWNLQNYHYLIVEIGSESSFADTNYAFRIHNGGFWDKDKSYSLVYDFKNNQYKIDLTQSITYEIDNNGTKTQQTLDLSKTTCIDFWGMVTDTSKYVYIKRVYATNQSIE